MSGTPRSARTRTVARLTLLGTVGLLTGALVLAGCGGSGSSGTKSSSATASASAAASASASATVAAAASPVRTTAIGVSVTGDFGQKPALTVPSTAAPTDLKVETLVEGKGAKVVKGETLVANYLGQTWTPKDGKVDIFDNSYDRKSPTAFQIGTGKVITGWDEALVGKTIGSRLLLAIPAAKAYGTATSSSNDLAGQNLIFVVDIVDALSADAAASGTAVAAPAGYPTVSSESGKEPKITSVKGVTAPTATKSALLIKGTGPAIDANKALALQFVQTDLATGKSTQSTWDSGAQVVAASDVLAVASALKGAKVGSRAIAVTAPSGTSSTSDSLVVIVDVVAQY